MPSPASLQYGSYYHIYNRGNNRENVFVEERNYRYFLQLYAKHILPVADTFAYCLLKNHFHFLVRTKTDDEIKTFRVSEILKVFPPSAKRRTPSQAFSNLFNAYAKSINKAHNRTGSLFEHPFGRVAVTNNAHFTRLIPYIHQNPQKHGFVDDFRDWPYTSYHALLSQKPTRLQRNETLAWFGDRVQFEKSHREEIDILLIEPLVSDDFD